MRLFSSIGYHQCSRNFLHPEIPFIPEIPSSQNSLHPGIPFIPEFPSSQNSFHPGIPFIPEFYSSRNSCYPGIFFIPEFPSFIIFKPSTEIFQLLLKYFQDKKLKKHVLTNKCFRRKSLETN